MSVEGDKIIHVDYGRCTSVKYNFKTHNVVHHIGPPEGVFILGETPQIHNISLYSNMIQANYVYDAKTNIKDNNIYVKFAFLF